MKLVLASGHVFEGAIEELKELKNIKPEWFTYPAEYNHRLLDIVARNDPSKSVSDDFQEDVSCVLELDQWTKMSISTSKSKVNILIVNVLSVDISLLLLDFNSDRIVEHFDFDFRDRAFKIIIDKQRSTADSIFIVELSEYFKDTPDDLASIKELGEHYIRLILTVLNSFIKQNSYNLSLKNFGYINFE